MSEYKCSGCNYTTKRNDHMKNHINKKNKCCDDPKIIELQVDIKCNYCNKYYLSEKSLKRHLKTCKAKELPKVNDVVDKLEVFKITEDCLNFMYLLREREFMKTGERVFKLGFTTRDINARSNGYPKGSKIYLTFPVVGNPESEFLGLFKNKFKQRTDIGTEYFEGDFQEMYVCCLKKVLGL